MVASVSTGKVIKQHPSLIVQGGIDGLCIKSLAAVECRRSGFWKALANDFSNGGRETVSWSSYLGPTISISQGYRAILQSIVVDRDPDWDPSLIGPGVPAPDRASLVILGPESMTQQHREDGRRSLLKLVTVDEREDRNLDRRQSEWAASNQPVFFHLTTLFQGGVD